ncbi:MAG: Lipid A export ATP-binding/permease protein MsbA [Chlamydiales bacterium]|nr:Lipid A export ATP-binding/permease protein MsbA [Chlamydiales bacterium]
MFTMLCLTLGSQMEMLSLGVIARTGPDFFSLFGKENGKKLETVEVVSKEDVTDRWSEISSSDVITKKDAAHFISRHSNVGLVSKVNAFLDTHFQLEKNIKALAVIIVCVAIFKSIALFFYRFLTNIVAIRVSRDLRQACFEHVQKLPMSFYHKHDIGQLSARVSGDAGQVASSVNSLLINYIQTPFQIVSTFLACVFISWKLTMLIFIGFPAIVFPVVYLAKKIKQIARQMQLNQEKMGRVLYEFLTGIMTIKIFAMEKYALKKFQEQNHLQSKLDEYATRYGVASRPILHSISSIFFAGVILVGLYVFEMAPGELLVYCGFLYIFYEPVKKFAEENIQIQRGVVAAERMFSLLDHKPTIVDEPEAKPFKTLKEGIEFRNVSFKYHDTWVLKDVSFTAKKGEIVALVGPTGAGKSTVVALLPRLYDVQKGEILIDGKPLKSYQVESLRKAMAFVPQKPFLFLDTVRENIAIGREYDDEQIQAAASNAHAEEFIVKMPEQYDSVLEELGKNLSGGQQQRLAIARALVTEAPILIMDEATSSLDALSEEKIRDAIFDLRGKLTQIIIAHRFSTIEHADKIIYIDHGRKVAEGTKIELMESCPDFKRMWELMHSSEKKEKDENWTEALVNK